MFLGPFEEGGDYQDEGIQGPFGFLHRFWDTVLSAKDNDAEPDADVERKLHQTIGQITEQMAGLHYNTCIAALMEYLNLVRAGGRQAARAEIEPVVPMIAPFAPHMAEELWARLGHEQGIFDSSTWPTFDAEKAEDAVVPLAVQINGKLRGTVEVPAGAAQELAEERARADENVDRYLRDAEVRRVIFVPGRLINFVVG
jgi:leucyl-tRNA synthetase